MADEYNAIDAEEAGLFSNAADYAASNAYAPTNGTVEKIFTDFKGRAKEKISTTVNRFTSRPSVPGNSVGGIIFDAIYAFGAGKTDVARQKAANAILSSKQGGKMVDEIQSQRIQQMLPMIIVGVIGIFLIGMFIGKR